MMVPKETLKAKFNTRFEMSQAKYPGRDYTELRKYVYESTFFDEPAARAHHNNFPGGLAQHVLNFTSALETLTDSFAGRIKTKDGDEFDTFLVALGHDLNKVGFYNITDYNKKIDDKWHNLKQYGYNSKIDPMPSNSVSLYKIQKHIYLSAAESLSIYWAEGSWSTYNSQSLDKAWKNAIDLDHRVYLTHVADMISSQMMEPVLDDLEVDKAIRAWK